jgi:hypothetical protein
MLDPFAQSIHRFLETVTPEKWPVIARLVFGLLTFEQQLEFIIWQQGEKVAMPQCPKCGVQIRVIKMER